MTANMLGIDIALINPKNAQEKIIKSCVKVWFEKNPNGLINSGDCSGFLKAVQHDLLMRPFEGNANGIFSELDRRPDWTVLGSGSEALIGAGRAANDGFLTIGVWQNQKGHGHVAIVTAFVSLLGNKAEHHAIGAWGQYGSVGSLLDKMSHSFGRNKHADIKYAKCLSRPIA